MVMRNPLYLDQELLQNAADYFGLQTSDTQIVEKDSSARGGSAGVSAFDIGAKGHTDSGSETTTSYETRFSPLRLLNDAIDAAHRVGDVKGISDAIAKGDFVEIEGEPSLTVASEVGAVLSKLLPALGASGGKLDAASFTPSILTEAVSVPLLFELEDTNAEMRIFFSVEPRFFYRSNSPESLAGDLTIFGSVERLIPQEREIPVEPWLLPGVPRVTRRAIEAKGMDEMLKQFAPLLGERAGDDYRLPGPALVLRPLAIY